MCWMRDAVSDDDLVDFDCSCENTPTSIIDLTSNDDFEATWPDGYVGPSKSGLAPGEYKVVIKSGLCEEVVVFTVPESDELLKFDFVLTDESCNDSEDGSIDLKVLGGVSPFQYFIDDVETSQLNENMASGFYTVKVIDSVGCEIEEDIFIKVGLHLPTFF